MPRNQRLDAVMSDTLGSVSLTKHVGGLVAGERRKLGLTLRALGAKTGISASTLCLIENGKSQIFFATVIRLAVAFALPLHAFVPPGVVVTDLPPTRFPASLLAAVDGLSFAAQKDAARSRAKK